MDFKSFVVAERTATDVAFGACGCVCVEWGRQSEWLQAFFVFCFFFMSISQVFLCFVSIFEFYCMFYI